MQEFIINLMNQYGYLSIFLLIFVENIFPPIPSEVILTLGGFMSTYTTMNIWIVILVSTIGSVAGAVVLYLLGRLLNVNRLERLFESKFGKILRLKKEDVQKADVWFSKHGKKTVLLCRFVPIVRSLISIPAGITKMKVVPFLALTTLGTAIWNTVLIFLGKFLGGAWEKAANYFDTYSLVALAVILLAIAVVAFFFIKNRFLKKKPEGADAEKKDDTNNGENDKENEKIKK